MDRETIRNQERERLVRSMAVKLATGNGIEVIAASRRKKKRQTLIYISVPVLLFIIIVIIVFVNLSGPDSIMLKSDTVVTQRVSLLQLLHQDLEERKITVNQYAFYLRDIMIRYDSLPPQYHPVRPLVATEEIYDSLCAVWMKIDQKNRTQLSKELPKIDDYLREFQYKRSTQEETE